MNLPDSTLVFDTETNGLPLFKQPYHHPEQPHIVQLGAILYDKTWRVVGELNFLIRPNGWVIPPEVTAIHGISTEDCILYGIDLELAMSVFRTYVARAALCVAHNDPFDKLLTNAAEYRCAMPDLWLGRKTFCTMKATTPICKLPGRYGYKWPQLQEAYQFFFGERFEGAHDAMADVRACGRIFNHGIKNGLFTAQ